MQQLERGAIVLVQTLSGVVQRRVWADHGGSVEICSERQFEALVKGWNAPSPIGFPRADINAGNDSATSSNEQ